MEPAEPLGFCFHKKMFFSDVFVDAFFSMKIKTVFHLGIFHDEIIETYIVGFAKKLLDDTQ